MSQDDLLLNITPSQMEVMKALTKSIVEDTVRQLREEIRHEIREEIRREFKSHFGDMTPSEHAVQHSRLDKFLNLTDHLTQNFWGQLIGGVVKWAAGLFLVGYFVWSQKGATL